VVFADDTKNTEMVSKNHSSKSRNIRDLYSCNRNVDFERVQI